MMITIGDLFQWVTLSFLAGAFTGAAVTASLLTIFKNKKKENQNVKTR